MNKNLTYSIIGGAVGGLVIGLATYYIAIPLANKTQEVTNAERLKIAVAVGGTMAVLLGGITYLNMPKIATN